MRIGLFTTNRTTIPSEPDVIAATADLTGVLADKLVEKGHDVTLYASEGSKTKAKLVDLGLPPTHLDYALQKEGWVKNLSLGMKLAYLSSLYKDSSNFDIIHLQTEPIYLGMALARLSKTPTIFSAHNAFNQAEAVIFEHYKDLPVVTISRYQQSIFPYLNYAGMVYDGIEIEKNKFYQEPSGSYMYFIGRLNHDKGISEAIRASEELKIDLKIAGAGNQEIIDELITPHLSQSITSVGILNRQNQGWQDNYGNAKVTLFPIQWDEPFGLVMIESMACGTPVIAFARGSTPEVIIDGQTGFLVNPSPQENRGNFIIKKTGFEGLCEAINHLYSMPQQEYLQMRMNSRRHVEENFTADKMVNGYEAIYNKIIGKNT